MTLVQISAILSLLLAFNVPQAEVNNVQAILEAQPVSQITSPTINTPSEPISGSAVQSISMPTCNLTITGYTLSGHKEGVPTYTASYSWTAENATKGTLAGNFPATGVKAGDYSTVLTADTTELTYSNGVHEPGTVSSGNGTTVAGAPYGSYTLKYTVTGERGTSECSVLVTQPN